MNQLIDQLELPIDYEYDSDEYDDFKKEYRLPFGRAGFFSTVEKIFNDLVNGSNIYKYDIQDLTRRIGNKLYIKRNEIPFVLPRRRADKFSEKFYKKLYLTVVSLVDNASKNTNFIFDNCFAESSFIEDDKNDAFITTTYTQDNNLRKLDREMTVIHPETESINHWLPKPVPVHDTYSIDKALMDHSFYYKNMNLTINKLSNDSLKFQQININDKISKNGTKSGRKKSSKMKTISIDETFNKNSHCFTETFHSDDSQLNINTYPGSTFIYGNKLPSSSASSVARMDDQRLQKPKTVFWKKLLYKTSSLDTDQERQGTEFQNGTYTDSSHEVSSLSSSSSASFSNSRNDYLDGRKSLNKSKLTIIDLTGKDSNHRNNNSNGRHLQCNRDGSYSDDDDDEDLSNSDLTSDSEVGYSPLDLSSSNYKQLSNDNRFVKHKSKNDESIAKSEANLMNESLADPFSDIDTESDTIKIDNKTYKLPVFTLNENGTFDCSEELSDSSEVARSDISSAYEATIIPVCAVKENFIQNKSKIHIKNYPRDQQKQLKSNFTNLKDKRKNGDYQTTIELRNIKDTTPETDEELARRLQKEEYMASRPARRRVAIVANDRLHEQFSKQQNQFKKEDESVEINMEELVESTSKIKHLNGNSIKRRDRKQQRFFNKKETSNQKPLLFLKKEKKHENGNGYKKRLRMPSVKNFHKILQFFGCDMNEPRLICTNILDYANCNNLIFFKNGNKYMKCNENLSKLFGPFGPIRTDTLTRMILRVSYQAAQKSRGKNRV